jgi:hypothetical protein
MKNEIKKADPLALLKTDKPLSEKEAEKIADVIAGKEGNVRLAKGLWWNKCKHGTREKLCNKYGWADRTMRYYARYSDEIQNGSNGPVSIPYTEWRKATDKGIKKAERIKLIESSKTEKEFRKKVEKAIEKKEKKENSFGNGPTITITDDGKDDPETETETGQETETETNQDPESEPVTPDSMDFYEAMEFIGMDPPTLKGVNFIYKGLAREFHPDKGGSPADMAKLNEAVKIIREGI